MIKEEQIIENAVFYLSYKETQFKYILITKGIYEDPDNNKKYMITKNYIYKTSLGNTSEFNNYICEKFIELDIITKDTNQDWYIREATYEEIKQIYLCKKYNKYIDINDISNYKYKSDDITEIIEESRKIYNL